MLALVPSSDRLLVALTVRRINEDYFLFFKCVERASITIAVMEGFVLSACFRKKDSFSNRLKSFSGRLTVSLRVSGFTCFFDLVFLLLLSSFVRSAISSIPTNLGVG